MTMKKIFILFFVVLITTINLSALSIEDVSKNTKSELLDTLIVSGVLLSLFMVFFLIWKFFIKKKPKETQLTHLTHHQKIQKETGIEIKYIKKDLGQQFTIEEINSFKEFGETVGVESSTLNEETRDIFEKKKEMLFKREFSLANTAKEAVHLFCVAHTQELRDFSFLKAKEFLLKETKEAEGDIYRLVNLYEGIKSQSEFSENSKTIMKEIEKCSM